ncbi:MAG TPA: hypothetical protein VFG51_00650 [Candidatus Saccharimonadia bacterium]|nr:hypothetical protein [Candidatus Saccharimonadia bacterium]
MPEDANPFSFFQKLTNKKALLILCGVGCIVFFNAFFGGFVLDDVGLILHDKYLQHFTPILYFQANTYNANGLYRPLGMFYFAVLRQVVGLEPFFYHFLSVGFHIANAYLVFLLFKRFMRPKLSLLLALAFLVHPMQVESVTYISGAAGVFCFTFGILAMLIAMREKIFWRDTLLIGLFLLCSVLFKESGIQFAAMLFAYRFLFYKKSELKLWVSSIIFGLVYLVLRFAVGHAAFSNPKNILIQQVSSSVRFSTIPAVLMYYIKTFLFPLDLLTIQNWAILQRTTENFYLPLLFGAVFVFVLFWLWLRLRRSHRKQATGYFFFLLWFLGGIGLYLQIFPLDLTVSDRWFYFPIVGLLGMIGMWIEGNVFNKPTLKMAAASIVIFFILFYSFRTMIRNFDWIDALTLYTHDNASHPSSALENAIGVEYVIRKDLPSASEHFTAAYRLKPNETSSENLAHIAMYNGDIDKAKVYFNQVLQVPDPKPRVQQEAQLDAIVGLGLISTLQESPTQSQAFILQALKRYPNSGNLWIELASVDSVLGQWDDALAAAKKAKELFPGDSTNILYDRISRKVQVRLDSKQHLQ